MGWMPPDPCLEVKTGLTSDGWSGIPPFQMDSRRGHHLGWCQGILGGVDARPKMPERGVKDGSTLPQEAGVTGMAISPGRPSPGLGGVSDLRRPARFTNMAVLKFDGTCWQQHQQVFNAIAKSDCWDDATAALQLFAHLEVEVLNVAFLMPENERTNW